MRAVKKIKKLCDLLLSSLPAKMYQSRLSLLDGLFRCNAVLSQVILTSMGFICEANIVQFYTGLFLFLQEEIDAEVGEEVYHLGLLSGKDEEVSNLLSYWFMFPHKMVQVTV